MNYAKERAHVFYGQLGAQVTPSNHGAVHRVQDLLQVLHAVCTLYFCQNADLGACELPASENL